MNETKIWMKDFKNEFTKELNRMGKNLEHQKECIENQNKEAKNYENRKIEITNAAIVNALINCIIKKGLKIVDHLEGKKQIIVEYYLKMISSHIMIFEDYDFYNTALITRYLLEAIAGIISNSKNLDSHFSKMDNIEFNKKLNAWNGGIGKKIREHLGGEYLKIYKTLSRYVHPFNWPFFGIEPKLVTKRNNYIIKSAIQIYVKVSKEIFEICNHNLVIDFEEHIINTIERESIASLRENSD